MHFLVECSKLSNIRQGFIQSLKDTLITKNAETCVNEIIADPEKVTQLILGSSVHVANDANH